MVCFSFGCEVGQLRRFSANRAFFYGFAKVAEEDSTTPADADEA